jgi:predicted O-methyltransferase YrrM
MQVFEFLALAVLVISVAGVVIVDRLFGAARRNGQVLLQEYQARLAELERQNDDLRQQLEWNRKLLEAQDRVLQQLPPGVGR